MLSFGSTNSMTNDQQSIGRTKNNEVSLAWRNLRYDVAENLFIKRKKVILERLTGHVRYCSLNGFMGPSGAGKTTLLSCLNGNIRQFADGTEMYVNKAEKNISEIGFIEQHVHETIVGGLTVSEVLYYAFHFKNHREDSSKMKEHIKRTLEELLLDPTIVERRFDQCSGGEQKRVAIAQELMSLKKPTFLFIDEPTTGLDSQAALIVMKCLRRLTEHYHITLMVSIHMPNDEIIHLLDHLYILAKGGVCIYAGSPENLRQNYWEQLNLEIDEQKPPIEEYLKLACDGINNPKVLKLAENTLEMENGRLREHRENLLFLPSGMPRRYKPFSFSDFFLQLYRLFYITMIIEFRLIAYHLMCYVVYYIFMATVFDSSMITNSNMCFKYEGRNESCAELNDRDSWANSFVNYQGHVFTFCISVNLTISAILFTPMLKIFRNEHRNRWYSMSTFYWSFILIRFVEMTLFAVVITSLMFFPTKMYLIEQDGIEWSRFVYFLYFFWLLCVYMQTSGQLLGLIFLEKLELCLMATQLLFVQYGMVSNYFINLYHMDIEILTAISNFVGTKYITNGLLYTFFQYKRCDLVTEYNQKMNDFHIESDKVFPDTIRLLIIIAALRLIGFGLMFIRFTKTSAKKLKKPNGKQWETIPIQVESKKLFPNSNTIEMNDFHRKKSVIEMNFEKFSKGKIIVGWRQLTLFGTNSIYEIRSVNEDKDRESKRILRDLNGQFRFGTLNALMGTSGAGKTSLLKVLNGRSKTRLSDETKVYLSKYTPARICYLTQEVSGHLWPGLTAKQSLIYASKLKNHSETEHQVNHELIAKKLLDELDIANTADTLAQNCSGGEKKRLALALELTAERMPNFICIDEPTSGLDSNSAEVVIRCLKRVVHRHNITIVASIHQPSTTLLMLFDECYVLARGGVCIYSGDPSDIPAHLTKVPEIGWTEENKTFPVEELIKCSCKDYNDSIVQKLVQLTDDNNKMNDMSLMEETQQVQDGIQVNRIRFSMLSVWFLCCRYWNYVRNYLWIFTVGYFFIYLGLGITIRMFFDPKIAHTTGCISLDEDFQNTCNRTDEQMEREIDLTNNARMVFFGNCFLNLLVMLHTGLSFYKESSFFFNEHRNGWYSSGAFYLMKSLFDILPVIPVIFIYVYLINIYEEIRPGIYWWMVLMFMLFTIAAQGVAHLLTMLIANSCKDNGVSNTWQITMLAMSFPVCMFFSNTLSNFFNPIQNLHYFYEMISYLNNSRWLHEGLILLQYGFARCGKKQIQAVLYIMGIEHDEHFSKCLQMLIFNMILYRTLALFVLIKKSNPVKNRRKRVAKILKFHQDNLKQPVNVLMPGMSSHLDFNIKQISID